MRCTNWGHFTCCVRAIDRTNIGNSIIGALDTEHEPGRATRMFLSPHPSDGQGQCPSTLAQDCCHWATRKQAAAHGQRTDTASPDASLRFGKTQKLELAQLDVAHIEEILDRSGEELWGAGHHRGGAGCLAKRTGTLYYMSPSGHREGGCAAHSS